MPSFREKVSADQARALVAHVRSFAPSADKPKSTKSQKPTDTEAFEREFQRLQEENEKLRRQLRKLLEEPGRRERAGPAEAGQSSPSAKSAESAPRPDAAGRSDPAPADRELFRRHCVRCHGEDGSGSRARARRPDIPDFTNPSWQAGRSDAQLQASILDGKGTEMPSFRDRIGQEEARRLAAHVRTFSRSAEGSGPDGPEESAETEPGNETQPPRTFAARLLAWLGKSHPPAVHFPIGLLTAAAVAELLRLVTGRPGFAAAARFCLWFGALSAVGAGALGWLLAGFRVTDPSWVLTTHRWLGTTTVVGAALALALSEAGRHPGRSVCRRCAPVTLLLAAGLVLATGFFGGAVVFGLAHFAWPP
jgi:mono/diheme cytochrome c family protein/uncharacterized membrane protein